MNGLEEISTWAYVGYVTLVFAIGYGYGYAAAKEKVTAEFWRERYRQEHGDRS